MQAKPVVLRARRLFDGTTTPVREGVSLLVEGDTIVRVAADDALGAPDGCETIDLGDRTLMPGIVDAHMHFLGVPSDRAGEVASESPAFRALRAAGEARKMLEAGITAARCLGSSVSPALRRAVAEGHVPGPRIVTVGEFICSTDGTWDDIRLPLDWANANDLVADGVDEMRRIVRRRIRQGANMIKIGLSKGGHDDGYHIWGDDPLAQVAAYSLEEVRALTDEAHLNRLRVSAHAIGDEAVRLALDGGVDVIEHGYGITDETRRRLVEEDALLVSTISQLYFHEQAAGPFHYPDWLAEVFHRHTDVMRTDFRKSLDAGVRYALGTDLIGHPTHPQDRGAKEFELAVEWGMTPLQALTAGTKVAAEAIGLGDRIGTLEAGKLADVIAVPGDPAADVTVLQRVEFVMQGGAIVADRTGAGSPAGALVGAAAR